MDELNPLKLYFIEQNYINVFDTNIYNYDNLFVNLLENNYSYKDLTIMTYYIIPRIISRNFIDEDGKPVKNKFGFFKDVMDNCINALKNRDKLEVDSEIGGF